MSRSTLLTTLVLTACLVPAVAGAQGAPPPQAPAVNLTFNADGTVSLTARGVTVRQILSEWARQCGCYVVNAERLTGAPMAIPLQFDHQDQARVLESLLRQAAGYVLTPRRPGSTIRSNYETIYIVPTSTAVASGYSSITMPSTASPILAPGSVDDEIPPVIPAPAAPAPAPAPTPPPRPSAFVPATIIPVGPSASSPATAPPAPTPNVTPPAGPLPGPR